MTAINAELWGSEFECLREAIRGLPEVAYAYRKPTQCPLFKYITPAGFAGFWFAVEARISVFGSILLPSTMDEDQPVLEEEEQPDLQKLTLAEKHGRYYHAHNRPDRDPDAPIDIWAENLKKTGVFATKLATTTQSVLSVRYMSQTNNSRAPMCSYRHM